MAQSWKDIAFATKEVDGNHFLATVRTLLLDALEYHHGRDSAASAIRQGRSAVANADTAFGTTMNTTEVVRPALERIDDSLSRPLPVDRSQRETVRKEVIDTLLTVIARIGDGSNLILDPDLDSYYVMDAVILKLPALVDQVGRIADLTRGALAMTDVPFERKAAFLILRGELVATLNGLSNTLESGYRGNADGSLQQSLGTPFTALYDALKPFLTALDTVLRDDTAARPDATTIESLRERVQVTADTLYKAA
ncbi:MAG: methyl-accepting chemotaxis sensory transducer [Rhodospirillaceae bacterium]|nr:MAG: methyl-accepting chemotaxis sensory transducer [Rhodospirillaceae bacterium]